MRLPSLTRTHTSFSRDLVKEMERSRELEWVERFSDLLDARLRIPGTKIRFGLDFLLGLVPGVGDLASMGFSGLLIAKMARHGASGRLVGRMLLNVGLDALVGSIPVVGNLFDLFFKANQRNARLMREYSSEGRHTGSIWPIIGGIVVFLVLIAAATIWLLVTLIGLLI